ncbi:MAG TPA: glycosyltransferase family 4 protein [Bacteroidota bacterium]|nr:glycosyltransferase family 4 protein [Bacteroidota bacterium]
MKTLTVVSAKLNRPGLAEALEREQRDEIPRVSLYQRYLESELLDEQFMRDRVPWWRKMLYSVVPRPLDQVIEAYLLRKRYDVVITWAERLGLPFALLLKLTGSRTPHVTLNSWISGGRKARLLKLTYSHISRILLWSSVQREYALNVLKIPPGKITFIRKFADQNFWRPMPVKTDMICSVGVEMRDYPTLIGAMRGLDIPCHIAAGLNRGILYDTVAAIDRAGELPANITVGKKSYGDLRDLYARSRFVVIPLRATDTDNGLTCMLEAMAMGKAVICSRTAGQVDVLRDGVTGIFVRQGDPAALREAILRLWNDPGQAGEMGRRGREYIVKHHSIEQFVESVRGVAEEVCGQTGRDRPPIAGSRETVSATAAGS